MNGISPTTSGSNIALLRSSGISKGVVAGDNDLGDLARSYLSLLLQHRSRDAFDAVEARLDAGLSIRDLYLKVFQPVQREVGRLWESRQLSIAQEHYITTATQVVMSKLYAYVVASPRIGKTFVAACVGDQLHEMGMRMVADFVEMEGWDTVYLGSNLRLNEIPQAVIDNRADALGLSATLPNHVDDIRDLVSRLRADVKTRGVHVIVGGYAFGDGRADWSTTGANSFARDANEAVVRLNRLRQSAA